MTADRADTHQAVADYTAGLPTKRMAAAVLFFDDTDRLLLVDPAYTKTYWELPGGCVEADESPRAAAVREIQEELGEGQTAYLEGGYAAS
jgi:8-oxo-dGTP diphosphatase